MSVDEEQDAADVKPVLKSSFATFVDDYKYVVISILVPLFCTLLILVLKFGAPCRPGYRREGLYCYVDHCQPVNEKVCSARGTCFRRDNASEFACQCQAPFTGVVCDRCDAGFREENGHCIQVRECKNAVRKSVQQFVSNYTGLLVFEEVCECSRGYNGSTCEDCAAGFKDMNGKCYPSKCVEPCFGQRGECGFVGEHFQCVCGKGRTGSNCEACTRGWKMVNGVCIKK